MCGGATLPPHRVCWAQKRVVRFVAVDVVVVGRGFRVSLEEGRMAGDITLRLQNHLASRV